MAISEIYLSEVLKNPLMDMAVLLPTVSSSYSTKELAAMSRRESKQHSTNMVESGWAAPFIIYQVFQGSWICQFFVEASVDAMEQRRGNTKIHCLCLVMNIVCAKNCTILQRN